MAHGSHGQITAVITQACVTPSTRHLLLSPPTSSATPLPPPDTHTHCAPLLQAVTARVSGFKEDVCGSPPYVALVWEAPGPFLAQLSGDGLAGVLGAVRGAHPPGCTLGLVVLGLRAHICRCV